MKDAFPNSENTYIDFYRLMCLFEGEHIWLLFIYGATAHPDHLPPQELPQGPRDRIVPRLQPSGS